ncbi:hypothetical protein CTH_0483 [Carboxydocella thermautotrophica]|nr:hypothetical protein CTH_0483 [Carboxydocella thermautotrophica]
MELNLQNLSVGLDTIWVLLAAALVFYGQSNGWFGRSGFFLQGDFSFLGLNIPVSVFWLFQAAFAVAVATIGNQPLLFQTQPAASG